MVRDIDGTDAVDRFQIDTDLLDPDESVWSLVDENGETRLYQEAPEGVVDPGGAVVLHYDNDDDKLLRVGFEGERTVVDEVDGGMTAWRGYPITDPTTGEEFEFWEELPDSDHLHLTPAELVN
ncbi:hypothetical protein [Halococcus saccharolyticus]|uniref:Uncharacterized protein n=1 Tax=Halococcus saccharolyticus DSM 5350 TaxID=1227455 RepID=M0MFV5_9EURY|nr:hypothetical protein [Halococcus saccharolyticus]EMA43554.1 hypothetical protein C449_13382 [Halococcus saccharolyticus DSM 5350]